MRNIVFVQKFVFVAALVALALALASMAAHAAGAPIISKDFKVRAAEGRLPATEGVTRFAYVKATPVNSLAYPVNYVDIALYPWATTAGTFEISSSSLLDVKATVEVRYVDADYEDKTTIMMLDGQNDITSEVYARNILSVKVTKADLGYNVGTVYVSRNATFYSGVPDGGIIAVVPEKASADHGAFFTVPFNKNFCITGLIAGHGMQSPGTVSVELWEKPFGGTWRQVMKAEAGPSADPIEVNHLVGPKGLIAVSTYCSQEQHVTAGFVGHLKEDE